ncbi:MAG: 16S rRNA (guanine(527)-N(7))-methyltransferase RsmG [Calditrichaeota bacterium]|nr:16S rRNA (guanine(527)-N(7))-methyltransferase RsmG [Calditrichota bacterium]
MLLINKKNLDTLAIDFNLSQKQYSQFSAFVELLEQWNKKTNLVSRGDVSKIVSKHIRESIAFSKADIILENICALDLGAGAGFPGVPLKIIVPSLKLTLLDSRKMKTLFLRQVVQELSFSGTDVICERAEDYSTFPDRQEFDVVFCRAVAKTEKLWLWSKDLLKDEGVLVAQKGGDVSDEMNQLKRIFPHVSVRLKSSSHLGDDRMFIIIKKN